MTMIESTPSNFIVNTNHTYPPHNHQIFEDYFYHYMLKQQPLLDYTYLPILWTNFYLQRGNGSQNMDDLQRYLDQLDRNKKYFTVIQYDDGILQDLKDLDLLILGAGGGGSRPLPSKNLGYPIPLLCQPAPNIDLGRNRDIFANFMGVIQGRHPIREQLRDLYKPNKKYFIQESLGYSAFQSVMERSIYALCPRGYGATSFRICEALHYGAIPVYIYDKDWTPWPLELDFNEIGVLIPAKDLSHLDEILNARLPEFQQQTERRKMLTQEYFSFDGCATKIIEKLKQ